MRLRASSTVCCCYSWVGLISALLVWIGGISALDVPWTRGPVNDFIGIDGQTGLGIPVHYNISLLPTTQWARLLMNLSSSRVAAIQVTRSNTIVGISSEWPTDEGGWISSVVLKPSEMRLLCPIELPIQPCTFTITIVPINSNVPLQPFRLECLRGPILRFGQLAYNQLQWTYSDLYAIEVASSDLAVQVSLVPNPKYPQMDLDLYLYTEVEPLVWVWPNNQSDENRNYYNNAPESAVIRPSSQYWHAGLYIIEVYSAARLNLPSAYTLIVTKNYEVEIYFGLSLFGIVGALTVLVLCILFAAAVVARRRRAGELRDYGNGGEAMGGGAPAVVLSPVKAGAPAALVARLPVRLFVKTTGMEEERCSICLCEYGTGESLRELHCGHNFHDACIDQWFEQRRHCPLCQQDIETAGNSHKSSLSPVTVIVQPGSSPSSTSQLQTPSSTSSETSAASPSVSAERSGASSPTHSHSHSHSHPHPHRGSHSSDASVGLGLPGTTGTDGSVIGGGEGGGSPGSLAAIVVRGPESPMMMIHADDMPPTPTAVTIAITGSAGESSVHDGDAADPVSRPSTAPSATAHVDDIGLVTTSPRLHHESGGRSAVPVPGVVNTHFTITDPGSIC